MGFFVLIRMCVSDFSMGVPMWTWPKQWKVNGTFVTQPFNKISSGNQICILNLCTFTLRRISINFSLFGRFHGVTSTMLNSCIFSWNFSCLPFCSLTIKLKILVSHFRVFTVYFISPLPLVYTFFITSVMKQMLFFILSSS